MRILCDIDGVLADLLPAWLESYVWLGGERVQPDSLVQYDFKQFVSAPHVFDQALARVDYQDVQPYPHAIRGIIALRDAGHELRFVSYIPDWCPKHYEGKLQWLRRYVPDFHTRELVFCHSSEKQFLDGDCLVEDYPKTLSEWINQHPHGQGVLVDQKYNEDIAVPRCSRVFHFQEIATLLEDRKLYAS